MKDKSSIDNLDCSLKWHYGILRDSNDDNQVEESKEVSKVLLNQRFTLSGEGKIIYDTNRLKLIEELENILKIKL